MFNDTQNKMLSAPLSPSRVKKRQGAGGKGFDHIEGWDAIRQANEVFGFEGWSREMVELRETWSGMKRTQNGEKAAVAYIARVRITVYAEGRTVIREGVGFGNGDGFNLGDAHELAAKEAETDAMKRALSTFGYGFGLALYDKTKEHVRDEPEEDGGEERTPPPPPPQQQRQQREAPKASEPPIDTPPAARQRQQRATTTQTQRPAQQQRSAPRETVNEQREDDATDAPAFTLVNGVKRFTYPKIRTPDAWREWSRQIGADIRAAANRTAANDIVNVNEDGLIEMGAALETDAVQWANDRVDAVFKNRGNATGGQGRGR